MKRNITVAAIVLLIGCLFLTGCPQATDPETPSTPTVPETPGTSTVPDGFIAISGGTFIMGGVASRSPSHNVTLTRNIIMCDHEVTQGEYETYCTYVGSGPTSTKGKGNNYPVYNVCWYNALVYCNKRSIAEGLTPCYTISGSTNPDDWGSVPTTSKAEWNAVTCNFDVNGYRLPTEAEWEYAARAGDTTAPGTMIWSGTAYSVSVENYAWVSSNSGGTTHEVKNKNANAWGLYDMTGNVSELCWSRFGTYTGDDVTDPENYSTSNSRAYRGGSWNDKYDMCYTSYRTSSNVYNTSSYIGFRVVRTWTGRINAATPTITIQPSSSSVKKGANDVLEVFAKGTGSGTLSYQWYKATSSTGTGTAITGATDNSYTTDTSSIGDMWYYCVVTNTIANNGGSGQSTASTTSNRARITVY